MTQRGNRRQDVFFDDARRPRYLTLLGQYAGRNGLIVQAYCLMSNHVHLVVVPRTAASLEATLRPLHLRYAQEANRRLAVTGHLWQGRYDSCVLDGGYFWAAVRYVERNPVRAGLVAHAEDWPWSSAAAHCGQRADELLSGDLPAQAGQEGISDWRAWLRESDDPTMLQALRLHTRTGRPVGEERFLARLERRFRRRLRALPRGRPPKSTPRPRRKADHP